MGRILFAIFALKLKHKLIKKENRVKLRPNDRNISTQNIATLLGVVRLNLTIYHTEHVAIGWPNARNVARIVIKRTLMTRQTTCYKIKRILNEQLE